MGCAISVQSMEAMGVTSNFETSVYAAQAAWYLHGQETIHFVCSNQDQRMFFNDNPIVVNNDYSYTCPQPANPTDDDPDDIFPSLPLSCRTPPPLPSNNECVNAGLIPTLLSFPVVVQDQTIIGATISTNLFGLDFSTYGPAVFYRFVGTGQTMKVSLDCGGVDSYWDSVVRIISSNEDCDRYDGVYHGRAFMCDDDAEIANIGTISGQLYYIIVEGDTLGDGPIVGNFDLTLDLDD